MTKRILLVTDEPRFFESSENTFQARGCDVFTAMSGLEAVGFLEKNSTNLVLCDGAPSDVSPTDLASAMGSNSELVIVASPEDNSENMVTYRSISSVQVVNMPVLNKELLKVTGKILGTPNRKFISILVQVKVTRPKVTTIFGKSKDLSESGLLVECSAPLILHDKVSLSFLIPGAEKMVQAEAFVARDVGGSGRARRYGLKFVSLKADEKAVIQDFLSGKIKEQDPDDSDQSN
jgi:CheY-like chemotaxis protein